jgi:dihydrofolate reductase
VKNSPRGIRIPFRIQEMRELTSDLFISLDGFASGVDQPAYFGYHGPDLAEWVLRNLAEPQVILMGRVTYEALAPFSASGTDEISKRMTQIEKIVFSSRLKEPLAWKNSRLAKGPLGDEITALKHQPGDPLRSIGSISLVKSLLRLGLLNRLRLMIFPLILGESGREPIFTGHSQVGLELVASTVLDSRLLLLEYRPNPPK